MCSPVNEKGVQASGVGGQGLKPLPSQSYHQIAVGAYVGLSSRLSLSLSLPPILPSFSLGSRSYSWFKFNCLLSAILGPRSRWWWNRWDQRIRCISSSFPSLSLSIYLLSFLPFTPLNFSRPADSYLCISREDAIEILEKRRILFRSESRVCDGLCWD